MLVLLVPALLAMGITGAVLSVLTYQAQPEAGVVFGEAVDDKEIRSLRRMFGNRGGSDENVWQYYAQLKWAERNGISVSRKEVGADVLPEIEAQINQSAMSDEWKEMGADFSSPKGQAVFKQLMEKYNGRKVTAEQYAKFFKDRGLGVAEYEAQQVKDAKVLRLKTILRDLGTVSPDEVWEKYQEDNHLRTLSLITLEAKDYAPDLVAEEGSRAFVSKKQVSAFYAGRKPDYNERRRVDVSYLGLSFVPVSNMLPEITDLRATPEVLEEVNKRHNICAIGSETDFEDELTEIFWTEAGKVEVERVMDAVADQVEAARTAKKPADLAAIASQVRTTLKLDDRIQFELGRTGQVELADLQKVGVLDGFASTRWFRVGETDKASDVLASETGYYVIQSKAIKVARTPPFKEVEARVREDYARGSETEREAYFEGHKGEFKQDQAYALRWWFMSDEAADGDHEKARQQLEAAVADAKRRGVDLLIDTKVPHGSKLRDGRADEATEADLAKLDVIKGQAKNVGISPRNQYSRSFAYEGGWAVFRLLKVLPPRYMELSDVQDKIAVKVALERAVERAEVGANDVLSDLSVAQGDALAAALKAKNLTETETEPFARTETSLKGIKDAGRLVGEAFSTLAVLDGPYFVVVPDAANQRVFVVRANKRSDAPEEAFKVEYAKIRADLLTKTRLDYQEETLRNMLLGAKQIKQAQVDYALALSDGPNGEARLTFRQVFLPPDTETIDAYLDSSARSKIAKAQQAIAKGTAWRMVVQEHSEHDSTRTMSGELPPLSREELIPEFGTGFVEAAFNLRLNVVSQPIESKLGLHLVRATRKDPDGRFVFQHILIGMDPKKVPADITAKAKKISKDKLIRAQAELAAGKTFGEVAADFGSGEDEFGRGQELKMAFVTHWERAAFNQYLQLELPDEDPRSDTAGWVPEAIEVVSRLGTSYHLFVCVRPDGQRGGYEDSRFLDRNVFHIERASKAAIEEDRAAFKKLLLVLAEGDDMWSDKLKAFKKLAKTNSSAPSKGKSGGMGLIRLKPYLQGLGADFLKSVCYQADGKPVTVGYRTSLLESKAGFHLVEIVKVETEKPEGRHRGLVAQQILLGTDWGQ
ncbi:MAG: peptidylprolyl isomerase [Planctomycetes bacterium]|nr:peptidylprolyl isomerase [Planctomycetota bacterium]